MDKKIHCQNCGKAFHYSSRIGRNDACPNCGSDFRSCLYCSFYDPSCSGSCREPEAERVIHKERANFCDYYSIRTQSEPAENGDSALEAKKKLESLFKK